jgi:diguanylate cyclase (GGDEF)-like protein
MQWKKLAFTDDLTGLWNYRAFYKLYPQEIARAKRHKYPLALVFLDLDKFKVYNDTYGHIRGDKLLKSVTRQVIKQLREYDNLFRLGGDEFIILLSHTDKIMTGEIMERINQRVKKLLKIGLSYGIAEYPLDSKSKIKLVGIADKLMYKMKKG